MTAMTCKLNSLFSIDEDFDDEDLLGTDWTALPAARPASSSAVVSSCSLSVAHREKDQTLQPTGARSAALSGGAGSGRDTQTSAGQTVIAPALRQLSCSSSLAQLRPLPTFPPAVDTTTTVNKTTSTLHSLGSEQSCSNSGGQQRAPQLHDDAFDEWDVDLAELDESGDDGRAGGTAELRPSSSASSCAAAKSAAASRAPPNAPPHTAFPVPSPLPSISSRSTAVFPGFTASASPVPGHGGSRRPSPQQGAWATPSPSPRPRCLFQAVTPATPSPRPPHAWPLLTNRLVQLVSASNRPPKRPRPEGAGRPPPSVRRFPGPAGLLPQQQAVDQSLDDIVVSVPQTPAHGAVARLQSQVPSSQAEEEDFGGSGPWAAMKADMGLDERHPSCFLHSYSVVMVLRKAALKQLAKNKVPNMAVLLKSIRHTHTDAKAVFKDPTGEIQGTVHRRLLEDRLGELKPGVVLLLKQVGVFSPSNRNHYLNITPNNLLRVYSTDGACMPSGQLPPLVLENLPPSPGRLVPGGVARATGEFQMQLLFDDEDDECEEEKGASSTEAPRGPGTSVAGSTTPPGPSRGPAAAPGAWDADDDDDLDDLMGELLEDA